MTRATPQDFIDAAGKVSDPKIVAMLIAAATLTAERDTARMQASKLLIALGEAKDRAAIVTAERDQLKQLFLDENAKVAALSERKP